MNKVPFQKKRHHPIPICQARHWFWGVLLWNVVQHQKRTLRMFLQLLGISWSDLSKVESLAFQHFFIPPGVGDETLWGHDFLLCWTRIVMITGQWRWNILKYIVVQCWISLSCVFFYQVRRFVFPDPEKPKTLEGSQWFVDGVMVFHFRWWCGRWLLRFYAPVVGTCPVLGHQSLMFNTLGESWDEDFKSRQEVYNKSIFYWLIWVFPKIGVGPPKCMVYNYYI